MDSGQCLRVLIGHMMMMMMMMTTTMFDSSDAENVKVIVGGIISLRPQTVPRGDIVWKHNKNLVVEFLSGNLEYYPAYEGRTVLDKASGQLNISRVTLADTGLYEVDVDNTIQQKSYDVSVFNKVGKPKVVSKSLACNYQSKHCNFDCVSNVEGAGPVTYNWMVGGKWEPDQESMSLLITNTKDARSTDIYCRVTNTVSEEQSEAFKNPFRNGGHLSPGEIACIIITIAVIATVVGLVVWKRDTIRQRVCPRQDYDPAVAGDKKESATENETRRDETRLSEVEGRRQ